MEWIILIIGLVVISLIINNASKKENSTIIPDKLNGFEESGFSLTVSTQEEVDRRLQEIKNEFNAFDKKIYNAQITEHDIKGLYYRPYQSQKRAEHLYKNEELFLEIEDNNTMDPYAIKVLTFDGSHIGYISRDENRQIRRILSESVYTKCVLSYSDNSKDVPFQSLYLFTVIPKTEAELKKIERDNHIKSLNRKIGNNKSQLKKAIAEDNTDKIVMLSKRISEYEDELKKLK